MYVVGGEIGGRTEGQPLMCTGMSAGVEKVNVIKEKERGREKEQLKHGQRRWKVQVCGPGQSC